MERPSERVLRFVERMTTKVDFEAAFAEIHGYLKDQPEQLAPLLMEFLVRLPSGGTYFHAGLSFVNEDEFGELVERSVALLAADRGHKAAQDCVDYGALQIPAKLQPHLGQLFKLRPDDSAHYACWPWRAAQEADIAFLQEVAGNHMRSNSDRQFAWQCLLETEDHATLLAAAQHPPPSVKLPVETYLDEVGFDATHESLRPLTLPVGFHIRFPDEYIAGFRDPVWRPKQIEPSWVLEPSSEARFRFGGRSAATCASCGEALHRMLNFDPVPDEIGIRAVGRLDLVTCLSCLGWEKEALFFKHEADGLVIPLPCGDKVTPEFCSGPLQETTVSLAQTPPRWQRQSWGSSNGRENLNRIGGHPTWIQSAQYPRCPQCAQKMPFLMQLDSDLPLADGGEWLWGSGGIGYFFWCDGCRISAGLWQCT